MTEYWQIPTSFNFLNHQDGPLEWYKSSVQSLLVAKQCPPDTCRFKLSIPSTFIIFILFQLVQTNPSELLHELSWTHSHINTQTRGQPVDSTWCWLGWPRGSRGTIHHGPSCPRWVFVIRRPVEPLRQPTRRESLSGEVRGRRSRLFPQ